MFLSRALRTTSLTHLSIVLAATFAWPHSSHANPEDGVVAAGSATITSAGNKLDVHQDSDRVVIDWRSFNIEVDEHTQFYQPSSGSIALNRVNDANPSYILGKLSANGNVILINPNGVLFGRDAQVDVNGLIATTADTTNENFMNGRLQFDKAGNPYGAIINEGHITAKEAGLIGFVAPNVINTGIIEAKLGRIHLAGGDTATVDLYGDGLMEVAVSDNVKSQAVVNEGLLKTEGGTIAMTAAAGKDIVNNLVVVKGELKAPSVGMKNGKISIFAEGSNAVKGNVSADKGKKQGGSAVIVQASLDASGLKDGERGGNISVLGDDIAILNGTVMNTSGHTGKANTTDGKAVSAAREDSAGGEILIGGDYLGQGETATANNLFVDTYTLFYNDALEDGDAGRTIFWSDNDTIFKGNVYARGGIDGGNGGFLETSGHNNLVAQGFADLTADNGKKGTYFLDPTNIKIVGNFAPTDISGLQLWLDATTLSALGNGASVSTWDNLAPINADATSVGNDPTYSSTAFGGRGGVAFTNTSYLKSGSFPLQSIFTVARSNSALFGDYEGLLGGDIANPNNGHIVNGWSGSTNLYAGASGAYYAARQNGLSVTNGTFSGINAASGWIGSFIGPSAATNTETWIGRISGGNRGWNGQIGEIIAYGTDIGAADRALVEQYQSLKWGIALDPLAGAGTEAAEAMDITNGYSGFTTRYLEHLSQTADISLQATNDITFDLKGDTLALSNDRNLTLTAGNDIKTTSGSDGMIQTTRTGSGGNITMTATRDIDLRNLTLKTNNGNIDLNAGRDVFLSTAVNTGTGSVDVDGQNISLYGGNIAGMPNLVAYYRFDEGTGTVLNDLSGYNNHGTLMNAPTWTGLTPSNLTYSNGSLQFDGLNDYVTIADSNSLDLTNGFTFSLWMKSDNNSQTNRYLLSKTNNIGSDNVYSVLYGYAADSTQFYASGNSYGYPSSSSNMTVGDTNWHHMTYTYDGSTYKSYKDGVLVGSTTLAANLATSTAALLLGTFNGAGYHFQGSMDDVRIYNTALTAGDVSRLATPVTWQTGTVNLNATNNITLDLKGETLNLAAGRNLTLSAGNNIANTSQGSLTTAQNAGSGGNISMTTAGSGTITLDSSFALNTRNQLSLTTAGGNISLGRALTLAGDSTFNAGAGTLAFGGTVNGGFDLTATAGTMNFSVLGLGNSTPLRNVTLTSANTLTLPSISAASLSATSTNGTADINAAAGRIITTSGAAGITVNAGRDVNFGAVSLNTASANGTVSITAGLNAYLNAINSGTGDVTVNAADMYLYGGGLADPTALIGYWKFDEISGTIVYDSSGQGNNGTYLNGAGTSTDIAGAAAAGTRSLLLDGTNDYVEITPNASLDLKNNFTVSLWYKGSNASNYQGLVSWGQDEVTSPSNGASRGLMSLAGGELINRNFNANVSTGNNIVDGSWHNLTMTVNSSNQAVIYKDGTQIASGSPALANYVMSYYRIGNTNYSSPELAQGNIDNVRMYNTVLSATEISRLSQSAPTWATGNLTLNAANNINFDLKGDVLKLASGKDLSATASNNITQSSVGSIETSGAGSINFTALNDITVPQDFDLNALGTGAITLRAHNSILYTAGGDITTQGGAITLNSDRNGNNLGAIALGTGTDLTSNGGNITLTGGAAGTDYAYGTAANAMGINLDGATITSGAGNIVMRGNGYTGGSIANSHGTWLQGGANIQSTTGSISVYGRGGVGTTAGHDGWGNLGNYLLNGSNIVSTSGNILYDGLAGTGNLAWNAGSVVYTNSSIRTGGNGTITINGINNAASGSNQIGTWLGSGNGYVQSQNGAITVNATSTRATADSYGLYLYTSANGLRTTGSGPINVTATANAASSDIYYGAAFAFGSGTASGDITINADKHSIATAPTFTTTGNVTFAPRTAATTVGVAGATGTMGITNAMLDNISASSVTIGRNDGTGMMRVAPRTWSSGNYNLRLLNGSGSILFDSGVTAMGTRTLFAQNVSNIIRLLSGSSITSTAAGNAVTLVSGSGFINSSGSTTPITVTGGGKWSIYMPDVAGSTLNGMTSDYRRFSCTYGGSCPALGTGNGFLHANTPVVTVTPDLTTINYNDPAPTFTYTFTGYLDSDAGVDVRGGSPTLSTPYTQGNSIGNYDISSLAGTLSSAMGYGFTGTTRVNGLSVITPVVAPAPAATTSVSTIPQTVLYVSQVPVQVYSAQTTASSAPATAPTAENKKSLEREIIAAAENSATTFTFSSFLDGLLEIDPELAKILKF